MDAAYCSSCKKRVTEPGAVRMACPSCTKETIIRCRDCRHLAVKYLCHGCGFEGPN
ncbi:RNA-binding protein [Candidatus Woesearchaeota archaeon]|nr:RNA-binding protein [Candidatus Woesearchaeota archaeon]